MTISTLRNSPSQTRSQLRVDSILAAARQHYAEAGRDAFNTNSVAVLAGCSIGTIYRYFDDRVALMNEIEPHRDDAARKLAEVAAVLKNSKEPNPRAKIRDAVALIDG